MTKGLLLSIFILSFAKYFWQSPNKYLSTQTNNSDIHRDSSYFDFDQVLYYQCKISDDSVYKIIEKGSTEKSTLNNLTKLLMDPAPTNVNDKIFYQNLNTSSFKKSTLSNTTYKDIDLIFTYRTVRVIEVTDCIAIYRDILVFKKAGQQVGVAKICFKCNQASISGTTKNNSSFGQKGDYKKLKAILNKQT